MSAVDRMLKGSRGSILATLALSLSACSFPTAPSGAGSSPTALEISTSPVVPSELPQDTPGPQVSPSAPPLPANAYLIPTSVWPETGDLSQPLDGAVAYEVSPASLSQGVYFVALDSSDNAARYVSLDGKETGVLLRLGEGLKLPDRLADQRGQLLLADLRRTSRFYDLAQRTAWEVGPICLWRTALSLSPAGDWIAADCEETIQLDGVPQPHTVVEILSTQEGVGYRIALPRIPGSDPSRSPFVFWIGPRTLIASNVWLEGHLNTCGFSLDSGILYCPPLTPGGDAPSFGGVEPDGEFVTLIYRDRDPWESAVAQKSCFEVSGACTIIALEEPDTIPVLTPNSELVWWITPLEPTQSTRIGFYIAPGWGSQEVAVLEGDYVVSEVCPDGGCLFLEDIESGSVYRLDLDGALTPFPHGEIIGSFSVP